MQAPSPVVPQMKPQFQSDVEGLSYGAPGLQHPPGDHDTTVQALKQALLAQTAAESVKNHIGGLVQTSLGLKRNTPEEPAAADVEQGPKRPCFDSVAGTPGSPRSTSAQEEGKEAQDCVEAPFALMWIRYRMPRPFNHGAFGLKLRQVVTGSIKMAVVSNYMVDFKWLLSACPALLNASHLVLLHGDNQSGMRAQMQEAGVPACCKVCCKLVLLSIIPCLCSLVLHPCMLVSVESSGGECIV